MSLRAFYKPEILRTLAGQLITVAARRRFSYIMATDHLLTTEVSLNGDDENKQSMTWLGYLFGQFRRGFLLGARNDFETVLGVLDLIKMKAEALKEQTTASRPIKALIVYPPNTPATLVLGVLPTKTRCLELEAELSKLHDKVQKDDHNELVKRFSNIEVNHLNLQLKYQNLKESFGNNTSLPARDAPDFDSVFIIGKMKASIQGKDNSIKKFRI
ncbi:hypothetical protein Tco_0921604 [Tanacetum coccineum]